MSMISAQVGATLKEDIAKAYVQAITAGSGAKQAGNVDFDALGCSPATVFADEACQKLVFKGKDGKAVLMEAITAANIATLVPLEDLRRVYGNLHDSTYDNVRLLFKLLSERDSSWFPEYDGDGKAKAILQAQLEATGAGGMYGTYHWPFDAASPEQAKITSAGVDFTIKTLPSVKDTYANDFVLYYWALQTNFSDMAYPNGFAYPQPADKAPDACKNTTTAWGHVGLQYFPKGSEKRNANWGGGGDGSGIDDYGCGGSDVSPIAWKANTPYEYRVTRGTRLGPKLWEWTGEIFKKNGPALMYRYKIYGGEYITFATTWAELIGVSCTDPKLITQWGNPWLANNSGKFRVAHISLEYGNDACFRSQEFIANSCKAKWTQHQGAMRPVGQAGADLLRDNNGLELVEEYCERVADPTEVAIAKAYVQAISGGSGAKQVSGAIDFTALSCTPATVWDEDKCQKPVFNGKDGKTILMEAITVASNGDWQTSNIKSIIPEEALRRIMTDGSNALALELFGYLSTQNDGWYDYLDGTDKAKEVLRQYMDSLR